jgi:hypothetical protein
MAKNDAIDRLDEQARVGSEIYKSARAHADKEIIQLKEEIEATGIEREWIGFIKRGQANRQFDELMDAVALYNAKKSKEYKKAGLTWASFCEHAGYDVRTADRIIQDLRPVFEAFSDTVSHFAQVGLSKIRYLGKSIGQFSEIAMSSDAQEVIVGDEKFPFTPDNIDDINAAAEALKERLEKQSADHAATLKASDRVQKDLHAKLVQSQKALDAAEEKLSGVIASTGLPEEEQRLIDLLAQTQKNFLFLISDIRKEMPYATAPDSAKRALYFTLIHMSMVALDERLALQQYYPDAFASECEISEGEIPPPEIMVSNMPLTRDLGKAFTAYMDRRKADRDPESSSGQGAEDPCYIEIKE